MWKQETSKYRAWLCIAIDYNPWSDGLGKHCHGLPESFVRERDLLNVGWAKRVRDNPGVPYDALAKGYYCDLSQGINEQPWRLGFRTLLQSENFQISWFVLLGPPLGSSRVRRIGSLLR